MADHHAQGLLFPDELQKTIREKFYHVETDPVLGERLFFENAGGSLRLKAAVEAHNRIEALPDNPGRLHATALMLQRIQNAGLADVRCAGCSCSAWRPPLGDRQIE